MNFGPFAISFALLANIVLSADKPAAEKADLPRLVTAGEERPADIDWTKARGLLQREQRGDKLSAEEQAYLDRAKEVRRTGGDGGGAAAGQRKAPEHLPPLCDMTASDRYEGEDGGLYGAGFNTRLTHVPGLLRNFYPWGTLG